MKAILLTLVLAGVASAGPIGKLYLYEMPNWTTAEPIAIFFDYPVALDPPGPSGYIWEPEYASMRIPEWGIDIGLWWKASSQRWESPDGLYYTENMRYNISDYTLSETRPDGTRVLRLESHRSMWEIFNAYQQKLYSPEGVHRFIWDEDTGDVNRDHITDAADAGVLFEYWGTSTYKTANNHYVDINADGIVDAADAGIVFEGWTGDAAPAPEPSSLWLLGIGAYYFRRVVAKPNLQVAV